MITFHIVSIAMKYDESDKKFSFVLENNFITTHLEKNV
jgi:hypothetical protein